MFIDTHCHISFDKRKEYVCNAKKENVQILINASEDLESSKVAVQMANEIPEVFACIGVHPEYASLFDKKTISEFEKLISNDKVVAIGEIGLDYYYGKESRDEQISVFKLFLDLASRYNLPVVIHSRDAYLDTINILKEYDLKGVIHCFSSSYEVGMEYIKLGYFLGIGGVLTFKNSKLSETVKKLPLSNILLETDSPFLAPHPFRGKENESKYIPIIAQDLAFHTGKTVEEIMDITTQNARKLFNLK